MHDEMDNGVERALDAIHVGGRQLVMLARSRVGQFLDALDEGDFRGAVVHIGEAAQAVGSLAHAQNNIAIAGESRLVNAVDLEVGMELTDIGTIDEKSVEPCERCHGHVTVKVGTHELSSSGKSQFFVRNDPAPLEDACE